jgi:hypothetical protein
MEGGSVVSKYLLPCSCGRSVTVEAKHAGRQVRCNCGNSLEVPTMLELARLERAEEEAVAAGPTDRWGVPQQFIVVGVAVLLIAICGGAWLALNVPQLPKPAYDATKIRSQIQSADPAQTLQFWWEVRRGLPPGRNPAMIKYGERLFRFRVWVIAAAMAIAVGAALTAAGLLLMRRYSAPSPPEHPSRRE